MKTEIISEGSITELQTKVNDWLTTNVDKLISVNISIHPMYDLYYDGNICNQWAEYVATIITE